MTTTTRRKRTLSPEELAAGGTPNVAATAGPTPTGAIGGDQVLSAARNRAETGQTQATPVTESMQDVGTAPGDMASTGEATTADVTENENPAMEPGATVEEPGDLDQMFEDYARGAFGEVDTSEGEAQMQAQQDRLLGRGLVDTRARMGEAGFAAGGLDVALENTARAEAAEQLGLDISGIRDREGEQRRQAIEGAMGLDIEKQSSARQDAILKAQMDALAALTKEGGEAPPAGTPITTTVTNQEGEEVEVTERPGESFQKDADVAKYGSEVKNSGTVGEGWEQIDTDDMGNTIWQAPDGTIYRVPKGWE